MIKSITVSQMIARLQELHANHGDLRVLLRDMDTTYLYGLSPKSLQFAELKNLRLKYIELDVGWFSEPHLTNVDQL